MKILHIALASYYVEGMNYQENALAKYNMLDGHETTVITTVYYWEGAKIVKGEPCDRPGEYGIRLIRMPYAGSGKELYNHKIRCVPGLYQKLCEVAPDVILLHGTQFWSILDVIRYKKSHTEAKLYADTHADANNSGTNWLSLHVLHRILYRYLTQKSLPYLEKYFYLTEETKSFSVQNYGVPEPIMEFYPLGGEIPSENMHVQARARRRAELGLAPDGLLFVHSGKLDRLKKTEELLRAFFAVPELNARLAVIGSIPNDMEDRLLPLMEADRRVQYLGWKPAEELLEYLCACDLYCQPGSQSATMQNAVCCGCPILLYPHVSYKKGFDYGNILWAESGEDMIAAFRKIAAGEAPLSALSENSLRCAHELLDYRKLAARLYE